MTSTEALVTDSRLFLRHLVSDDRDEFITIRETSREFHIPWEPIPEDGSDPIGGTSFERFVATCDTSTSQKHLICRNADGVIVGYVSLSQIFMVVFGAYVYTARLASRRGQRYSQERGLSSDRSQVWF